MRDDDLIEPLIPALRRFAWGLCRNPDEADDLVQDCVERALDRWHLRRQDGNLRAWLFTILYHQFINNRRRSARRGLTTSIEELAAEPSIDEEQENNAHLRDVMDGIQRLPEDHRAVILLVGVDDMSYDEAARILGVPVGTVMSRLSRGREKLRRLLNGELPANGRRVP